MNYGKVKALRVKEFQNTIKLVNDGFYYTALKTKGTVLGLGVKWCKGYNIS